MLQRSLLFIPEVIVRFSDNLDWGKNLKWMEGNTTIKSKLHFAVKDSEIDEFPKL